VVKENQENDVIDVQNEALAIIGMNCQFPGVDSDIEDVTAFYEMLIKGQTPIKEVPKNRWDMDAYYDPSRGEVDKIVSRQGGFLNDPQLFDATFFKIASTEAKQIDPQHRLFLEVAIRALNHANITLESLNNSNTAVYCGISTYEYSQLNYKDNIEFNAYTLIGEANSAASGRLSHFLNLKGPSMAVDTACSSSLAALYLAAAALRMKQCNMAIVGGVHLSLCPENFIGFTKANMLSALGQCRSFDDKADGFVHSEGCAVVIVKRLSDALKDNDEIYAVIKSIVMNQDGDDGTSLLAPNIKSQIAMHQAALEQADLHASDLDYIETHGTGTVVGDSVEFNAIKEIHQGQHSKDNPLIVGAVKSNLGHTISASGLASLLKAICALTKEMIPPNLHYSFPSSSIDPTSLSALIPVTAIPFMPQQDRKRYVQISNFGFSGTNVSTIIEEAPHRSLNSNGAENGEPQCLILSANSDYSLKQMIASYPHYLRNSSASLSDICCTLINCRDHYRYRCTIIAKDKDELIKKIEAEDYELKKVGVKKEIRIIKNEAQLICESFLSGFNLRLDRKEIQYNKVVLPLYCFDRKPYWHEVRKRGNDFNWLIDLYQQSKEQQLETIKTKIAAEISALLKTELVDENQDFGSLGLTYSLLETLEQRLAEHFSYRSNIASSGYLTLDKLARHLQQVLIPTPVCRQPVINVLNTEPIAIIGMSCRLPKAANIDEFLSLLEQGKNGMSDIPKERWDNKKYYDPDLDALGRLYIKQLGLIDNVKNFDAEFFNISPREAKLMAPQLRVFMETSFHALEDANLSLTAIKDSNTGVFVGCGTNEYPQSLSELGVGLEDLNIYFATGNVLNALPGRVAYAFDFHGPIQAIDTACSSSMTAIHNACVSLQAGDCDMALAGGINILLTPESNITLSKARMLSPDSRCKTFSADADGYGRSEGCGVLVLKRFSSALKDNDTILAVIKGSSINSDGKSGGFTVPNGIAQEEVIRSALAKAELSPADIDYIEAHGTGTPLADPIEFNALTNIFSEYHSDEKPLYIGSVKTNIGHLESASGVAGVIKAVLSLQSHKFFKHLNFKKLNPAIELKNTIIPLSTTDWSKDNELRCAGVSSFGFSGANAHIIVQEVPPRKTEVRTFPEESLLLLSARSRTALELLLARYQKYLLHTQEKFVDICFTAATCRSHFLFRVAIKARTAKDAAEMIEKNKYTIQQIKKEKSDVYDTAQQPQTLDELQTAYEDGVIINWADFYKSYNTSFIKVKLPLYEFAREEHWYDEKDKLKDAILPKDWCFQLQWQQQSCDKKNRKAHANHWLLIGAQHLAEGFRAQGLSIVGEGENYSLENLDGVIFAAGLDAPSLMDIEANIEFQKQTIKKLLHLLKELNQNNRALSLMVLSTNALAELAVEELNLGASPLVGFCRTLVLELPQFQTIFIDADNTEDKVYVPHIIDEMNYNHQQAYEHMVAYREGKRLVARLKKTTLIDKKKSLAGDGRYLVTGGCGGLGLITAQALLSAGAKELILTSRNVDKPLIKKAVKKIKSNYPGRTLRTVSLDVTHKEKLRSLLLELNADGLLKGIVHAAGTAIKASLLEHQDSDVDYLFSAKVTGGWYLHELSQNIDLDFFVVYSSISSVFGSNKESVYSGTNSFLDALIAERHRLGLVGASVQWGPWGEVGMAKKRAQDHSLKKALVSNEQGHVFIKIIINDVLDYATIISPDYLRFMLDFVPKPLPGFHKNLADGLSLEEFNANVNLSPWLNEYLEVSKEKQLQVCKDMLSTLCKEVLERSDSEDLDEDEGFFEIGFDSLMITEMASKLKKKLEPTIKVTVNIGFNYPSINKLAKYIESELAEHLVQKQPQKTITEHVDNSIAIIGMSCRLPNAADITAFEVMLEEGKNGMQDIPIERWDNKQYYDPNRDAPGKSYVNKLGLIENIKCFDANFFGVSPREAKLMEPQQRIFLECSYNALENANYCPEALRGSLTGVFAGVGPNEYYAQLEKSGFSNEELSMYSITGNVLNLIPGRVAYTFDFKGPSLSVDTACSSSLVAIHYACQSLKNREIDYALAGGVNVLLMPESNVTLCKARALSPEGQCKAFDEHADGYARAEGCGVIFLKRLSDAVRDKDTILAVIKASAVNNDGKSAGLTVPNGKSQEEVMLKALSQTALTSNDINYIEAHGTGTPLGDPIEVAAINNVYGRDRRQDNPLCIGTVKTNIGHLESAAGVVSVIKTVISLQKKKIYKLLHFKKLNPYIHLGDTRLALHDMAWSSASKLNCAGVNAFGFSGTNAHVIVQEYPQTVPMHKARSIGASVLILSAKSQTALTHLAQSYQQFLATSTDDFADICFSAATCREHYSYRLVVVAKNALEASQLLKMGHVATSYGEKNVFDLENALGLQSLLVTYLNGEQVDWPAYYQSHGHDFVKVSLPHYTFDLLEFWIDKKTKSVVAANEVHPLLGQMLSLPAHEYLFTHKLDLEHLSYIKQSRVFDKVVFPASAYIESGLAAAKAVLKKNALCLKKFHIERPLYPKQDQEFQLQVKPKHDDCYKVTIFAKHEDNWQLFAEVEIDSLVAPRSESIDMEHLKSCFDNQLEFAQIYEHFKKRLFVYSDEMHVLQEAYIKADSILVNVLITKSTHGSDYYYHPVALEGLMQAIALLRANDAENSTYVLYAFKRMITYQEAPRSLWAHLRKQSSDHEHESCFDVSLYDNSGLLIADIEQLKLRRVNRSHFTSYEFNLQHLYQTKWSTINLEQTDVPELLVIAQDPVKAKVLLADLSFKLIHDLNELSTIEHKNIVFLYDQSRFSDLVHCCQKLFKIQPNCFILVTENAYAIQDKEPVNPYHTMASSFWKSFSNELEFNKNYTVDLDASSILSPVLKHLFTGNNVENQFAVRDAVYIPRLKNIQLPVPPEQPALLFKSDASYLITGGTGGVGRALIEYLMNRGARHIIVTSRSECSNDLNMFIEQAHKKQVFIKHHQVDASSYQQMEQLISEIEQDSVPLQGIFHLAGIVQDALLVNLSDVDMQSVLSAKMDSALILHQLTKNIPLDLFVLFSSSASVLGARGQANYVAANGFLDGLAHLRRQQGLPALAINWGPFDTLGMTVNLTPALQQHGFRLLDKDSVDVLDVLLQCQLTQIVVCPVDWELYFQSSPKQLWLSELIKSALPSDQHFLNILRRRSHEEGVVMLCQALRDIAADVLSLDDVDQIKIDSGLISLGLDSLMAIEIRNRIHDKLQCPGLNLSIEYFINEPSISKVAKNIADELGTLFDLDQQAEKYSDANLIVKEAALCDFQYVFWVLNKLGYGYNIGAQLKIHGKLNKEYVAQSFDFIVQQNNVFWLSFDKDAPIQVLNQQGHFELIYKDISLSSEKQILNKEFHNSLDCLIPLSKQPLIRVSLYKINSDLHELHIVIPHIIVDGPSCDLVLSQFQQNYEALVMGKKLILEPEKASFLNFVQKNNQLYDTNLQDKINFWRNYNKGFKMLYLGRENYSPQENAQKYLFHYVLDTHCVEQFAAGHRAKNMNVSLGLIAVCHIAFYKLSRQNKIPFMQIHSGREGSHYNSVIGLFSEYKRINSTLNEQDKFSDLVKALEEQQLKTAPYQKCSHVIKSDEFKGAGLTISHFLLNTWNKFVLEKQFKKSKLNTLIIDYYLNYLSWAEAIANNVLIKKTLNKLFKLKIPLEKPERLRVLINITPTFFIKTAPNMSFANLHSEYANHFGSEDRPISNRSLWILFSRNKEGDYLLSINGPLTKQCKDKIASEFAKILTQLLENDARSIADLISSLKTG
jgi:acyl transferase domain-containing protein/acyl carrier protein